MHLVLEFEVANGKRFWRLSGNLSLTFQIILHGHKIMKLTIGETN